MKDADKLIVLKKWDVRSLLGMYRMALGFNYQFKTSLIPIVIILDLLSHGHGYEKYFGDREKI